MLKEANNAGATAAATYVCARSAKLSTEGCPRRDGRRAIVRALSSTRFSAILILQFAAEAPDAGGAE
jgi:hypothetical protein